MKHGQRLAVVAVGLTLCFGVAKALHAEPPAGAPAADAPEEQLRRHVTRELERRGANPKGLPPLGSSSVPASGAPSAAPSASLQDELARRWAELVSTRRERRERHRAALVEEVGARLNDPAVKAELSVHATRLAELARLEFLAKHARSGAQRDKLLARIAKLVEREAERHRKRLLKLGAFESPAGATSAPAPSGSGVPR